VWGESDRILPVPAAAPGLPMTIVPRTGHLPHMEAAMKVNRLIVPATGRVAASG
jgi:hypothetical protein